MPTSNEGSPVHLCNRHPKFKTAAMAPSKVPAVLPPPPPHKPTPQGAFPDSTCSPPSPGDRGPTSPQATLHVAKGITAPSPPGLPLSWPQPPSDPQPPMDARSPAVRFGCKSQLSLNKRRAASCVWHPETTWSRLSPKTRQLQTEPSLPHGPSSGCKDPACRLVCSNTRLAPEGEEAAAASTVGTQGTA